MMGIAYKKDIDDDRESPSLKLIELLKERGAVVSYNDSFIPKLKNTEILTLICLQKNLPRLFLKTPIWY